MKKGPSFPFLSDARLGDNSKWNKDTHTHVQLQVGGDSRDELI